MAEQVSFTLPNPYQSEMADIARRQRMAELLQQQAYQPGETFSYNGIQARTSPLTGIAKALQGYMSMKMQKDLINEQKALGEKYRTQSAEEGTQFMRALRGTPAVEGTEGVKEYDYKPTAFDLEQNPQLLSNLNPQQQAEVNLNQMPTLISPAQKGLAPQPAVGPDLARALEMSMGSINPMVQSAGGALLAQMVKPKEVKWEKVELPTASGGKRVGFVDINAPDPVATFRLGGEVGAKKELVNVGGSMLPYTGYETGTASIERTVSPDTSATLGQQQALADRAFYNLSAAQQQQAKQQAQQLGLNIQEFNLRKWQAQNPTPQIVQSENGYVAVNPRDATSAPVTTAQGTQLAGAPRQAPEAYSKQASALLNMTDALNKYQNELKGFSVTTSLRPDERARVGTTYQNALLQAKEIYNLGVLNGPDKAILEQIIANPLDIASAPISTSALIKQVEALRDIIDRQNTNLATVYKQPKIELPKAQEQQTQQTMRARNPSTGQEIISTDGGKTWQPVQGAR
jgi:hypothetical protein